LISAYSTLPTTITFEVILPVTGIYLFRVDNMYGGSDDLISGELGLLVEVVECSVSDPLGHPDGLE
jgi:hypothetical protein